jgi:hypothetical protein
VTTHETTFRRTPGNRIVGLLVYALVLPILAIVLCPLVSITTMLIMHLAHAPQPITHGACVGLCLLTLVGLVSFAVYDYRRRAGIVVTVADDGLKVKHLGKDFCIPFDQVDGVRLVPYRRDAQCILEMTDGREYQLPVEVVPFSVVQDALEATVVSRLVDCFDRQLAQGGSIRVHDHALRAWLNVIQGILAIFSGTLLLLTLRGIPVGIAWIRGGWLAVRRGWRGRSTNFEVTREGLRPSGTIMPSDVRLWSWLKQRDADTAGLVLRFEDGCVFTASLFAENYWPFAQWLRQLGQEH